MPILSQKFKSLVALQISGYCHIKFKKLFGYDYPGTVTKILNSGRTTIRIFRLFKNTL